MSFKEKLKKNSKFLMLLVVVYLLFLIVVWGGGAVYKDNAFSQNVEESVLDEAPEEPMAESSGAAQVASDWIDVLQKLATLLGVIPGIVLAWKKMFSKG